jgi:predicted DNA binding CopG/RHH family protein
MAKRRSASSAPGRRAGQSARHIPDSRIDFSDISESTPRELKRARRVGRPATGETKQIIAIHIHPRLLNELRRLARQQNGPYQTLIHEILERAVRNSG